MAECELCKRLMPAEPINYASWEWFTGYFDRTVHFCPGCKTRHGPRIKALFAESRLKPEGGQHKKSASEAIARVLTPQQAEKGNNHG